MSSLLRRAASEGPAKAVGGSNQGADQGEGNGFWQSIVSGAAEATGTASGWIDDAREGAGNLIDTTVKRWDDVTETVGGARDWWNQITDDDKEESPSGWAPVGETRNVSAEYDDLVDRAAAGENTLPEDAQDYVYLNVPGLFTERYPGYMEENMNRMTDLGLDSRMVDIDTDASVEHNAEAIRDAILKVVEEEGHQVVLNGHSKGGVDIAAALAMYPELAPHVRAVVAMQTPYGGTPIASDVAGSDRLMGVASRGIEGLLGGESEALTDLSYDSRQEFIGQHAYPTDIPTVSFGSTSDSWASGTALGQRYMDSRYGLESDGLVPLNDSVLPGSDFVQARGLDHAAAAMLGPFGGAPESDPGNIQQALLTLALNKANEQDANGGRP